MVWVRYVSVSYECGEFGMSLGGCCDEFGGCGWVRVWWLDVQVVLGLCKLYSALIPKDLG